MSKGHPQEQLVASDKYSYCNHHHELTPDHELVDFGTGQFVANKAAIPLLKALNEAGLITRTHHYDKNGGPAFVSILLDSCTIETQKVHEARDKYDGAFEILIRWDAKPTTLSGEEGGKG